MPHIDLNCDLGESFGAYTIGMDEKVIPFITSANVACGFHAGDPLVMDRTVAACKAAPWRCANRAARRWGRTPVSLICRALAAAR